MKLKKYVFKFYLSTDVTILNINEKERKSLNKDIMQICGSCDDINTWIYRDIKSGVFVREAHIKSVVPTEKKTEIVQITDVHLNYTDADDEADEEVMYTKQCRIWNADGVSVKALVNAMEYAKGCDRIVITGDTLDYLTKGSMKLMQKYIWDVDPECIVTLGGHDITKQMQTRRKDKLTLSQRQAIVQEFWKHDIFYSSELLNDNVMIIQLDNSCGCYWESQILKLEKDLSTAREKGYTVLIFQHEAISTGRKEDKEYKSFYVWADCADTENFYDNCIGGENSDEPSMAVYKLITENADIIRGLFCGHYHTSFYMEVEGSYLDKDGIRKRKTIPQYVLECNVYEGYTGHVLKITVE